MVGDLPPSSSVTFFSRSPARAPIWRPVWVEPVKEILATPGWVTKASPASGPVPVTMFRTPGGKPASMASWPRKRALSEEHSEGLSTTVQPAASAGATFQAAIMNGTFQGAMAPTTPTGSRRVKPK